MSTPNQEGHSAVQAANSAQYAELIESLSVIVIEHVAQFMVNNSIEPASLLEMNRERLDSLGEFVKGRLAALPTIVDSSRQSDSLNQ